ncbi:flagellar assembly protein FliW [Terribacillus sp. DMT04]|uniref:flagellar assembly protein FliW n=1 Tax=Terribacillus sp. DMT04 TaxID=2850441 RepID=UPI001C2C956C|nr:flagellar assembly protein FliW [Terribacillus sp. DMT04]QXE00962.1 flagellar assembly protein FliW [Terribacillus sp. DMT04]
MDIETKYFGNMNIDEKKVIRFENGLPGFYDEKAFALIDFPDNPVFQILQSVTAAHVAFVVTNPYHFHKDYEFDLSEQVKDELGISKVKQVKVLSILTLRDPFDQSTINLQAPLIINADVLKGQQVIVSEDISPRTPLQPEKAKVE